MIRSLSRGTVAPALALFAVVFALDAATSQTLTRPRTIAPQQEVPKETEATTDADAEAPAKNFVATAYSLRGRTASGHHTRRGIIAADRRVLPLGTRVRLSAGSQSGEYVVADTGGAVRGNKIDIWVPSTGEAMRFGRRNVRLTVLQYPRGSRPAKSAAARPNTRTRAGRDR